MPALPRLFVGQLRSGDELACRVIRCGTHRVKGLSRKVHLAILGAVALLWFPRTFDQTAPASGSAQSAGASWVRITDTRELKFDGDLAETLNGRVSGTVSTGSASVFLVWRAARQ